MSQLVDLSPTVPHGGPQYIGCDVLAPFSKLDGVEAAPARALARVPGDAP
jgi:hypothetical protein